MNVKIATLFDPSTSSEDVALTSLNSNNSSFINEIDSETLIDSFRRIEIKISPFKVVSEEKYNSFIDTLRQLKEKYENDEVEYQEALKTNKLTLVCKPDFNMNLKISTLLLEKEVNEYDIEYVYLITKKRLEEFIIKLEILYTQIIKKKKQYELYNLVNKAKEKLFEICHGKNTEKLSKNIFSRREEIVSLTHKAAYMISKCYVRLEFPNVDLSQYFELSDETEYLKYITNDLKSLEEVFLRSYSLHPNSSKIQEKLGYLISFGFKEQKHAMLNLSFFKELFYLEDKLIPEINTEIKDAFSFIDDVLSISDDEKFLLKLFLAYYKNKLEISDICKLILLFDKNIVLSHNDTVNETYKKIFSFISSYDSTNSNAVFSDKYKFAISIEIEDEKRCKRALKKSGIDYRIKESECGNGKDIYLPQEYMENISAI